MAPPVPPTPPDDDLRDVLCEDRTGFLFDHPCKRMARVRCVRCRRAICEQHRHPYQEQSYCTPCVNQVAPQAASSYGDSPYFYGRRYHPYYQSFWLYDDDPDYGDFTDADGASTYAEGDDTFESDVGAS